MNRSQYILYRILVSLVELGSRGWNAIRHGGSTHQTTSSRAHQEAELPWPGTAPDPEWVARRDKIDRFFEHLPLWREKDHCRNSHRAETERAIKTLARNNVLRQTNPLNTHQG